jgi:hypothetical protein
VSASLTIRVTEYDDPDGRVEVDFDIEGFDINTARQNGDLPPALLLGAEMLKVCDDLERDGRLEAYVGRYRRGDTYLRGTAGERRTGRPVVGLRD